MTTLKSLAAVWILASVTFIVGAGILLYAMPIDAAVPAAPEARQALNNLPEALSFRASRAGGDAAAVPDRGPRSARNCLPGRDC
jgi:hypothetical protein